MRAISLMRWAVVLPREKTAIKFTWQSSGVKIGLHSTPRARRCVVMLAASVTSCSASAYAVMWYYVAAAVVVGFAVAYAAMFGFDKLKEALGQIKKNNE